ncbi:MAG: class I SAM-dependent methyltransferase [Actinobacteria bacterium]|nr:class I SAM-dependent methyltransferase [Actinomycetota bacterium]
MSELDPRLDAIVSHIPPGSRVADIGTDHALLPVSLVKTGRASRVVATELNEKPYQTALRQVMESGVNSLVEVRRGDGLVALRPGEVDVVVIAGMGGNTIAGVLERSPEVLAGVTRLVLQPMSDPGDLRMWLARNGWRLADEELVKDDGKFYVIIAAVPGEEPCRDGFMMEIGPVLVGKCSPYLVEYLEKIKGDYQRVLSGLARSRSDEAMAKAIALTSRLTRITEVINRCRQGAV